MCLCSCLSEIVVVSSVLTWSLAADASWSCASSDCDLEDLHIPLLVNIMRDSPGLQLLDIGGGNHFSLEGCRQLANSIKELPSLSSVRMNGWFPVLHSTLVNERLPHKKKPHAIPWLLSAQVCSKRLWD